MRAVRSRAALQDAMLRLLRQKPLEQITIRDICAESGIHKTTFFRHHSSKESLLTDVAANEIRYLNDLASSALDASDYEAALVSLCSYVEENRILLSTLLNGGAASVMRAEWVRYAMQLAAQEPIRENWLPRDLATIYAATLFAESIAWWVGQPEGTFSAGEMSAILSRISNYFMLSNPSPEAPNQK